MPSIKCNSRWTTVQLGRWTADPLVSCVFNHHVPTENKHTLTPSHPCLCSRSALWFGRFLDAVPYQTTGSVPFSSCSPPISSPLCQLGLEQMGWFSLASHQLTQWHVKQAVAGLAVPGTTILYCHMGLRCPEMILERQTVRDAQCDLKIKRNKERHRPEYVCRSDSKHTHTL